MDGFITNDDKGRIGRLNPAAERLFGYREQEAIGRNGDILIKKSTLS
jgi:PAS domain S-box-containing protein